MKIFPFLSRFCRCGSYRIACVCVGGPNNYGIMKTDVFILFENRSFGVCHQNISLVYVFAFVSMLDSINGLSSWIRRHCCCLVMFCLSHVDKRSDDRNKKKNSAQFVLFAFCMSLAVLSYGQKHKIYPHHKKNLHNDKTFTSSHTIPLGKNRFWPKNNTHTPREMILKFKSFKALYFRICTYYFK